MCIFIGTSMLGDFTFTQLNIDMTPKMLLGLPSFQNQRLMNDADPYEFYDFKSKEYPFLTQGIQVDLKLEGYKIFYDKEHFSNYDINELKNIQL